MWLGWVLAGVLVCAGGAARGQATGSVVAADRPLPVYDIVSVKPNKSQSYMMGANKTPGGEDFTNWSLLLMAYNVFGIRPGLIFGMPEWGSTEHWDVGMKVSDPDIALMRQLGKEQRGAMAAAALEDRFKLKVHKETRELPVYELVVAKAGVKLTPSVAVTVLPDQVYDASKPGGGMGRSSVRGGNGRIDGVFVPMATLISTLSNSLNRTVVDKTGLTGKYDFALRYTPEGGPDTEDAPSIFTAVEEQLGLKLVPAKGPVTVLVVDHAERPAEN